MDIGVGSVTWVELKRLRIGLWATTHPKLGVWTRRTTRVAAERKSRNGRKLGADPVEMPANCPHEEIPIHTHEIPQHYNGSRAAAVHCTRSGDTSGEGFALNNFFYNGILRTIGGSYAPLGAEN